MKVVFFCFIVFITNNVVAQNVSPFLSDSITSKKPKIDAAQKAYWAYFCTQNKDYAQLFPTVASDSTAQYILNNILIKHPNKVLPKLNDSNLIYIRVLDKAEFKRNYNNIPDKIYGVKIKAHIDIKLH